MEACGEMSVVVIPCICIVLRVTIPGLLRSMRLTRREMVAVIAKAYLFDGAWAVVRPHFVRLEDRQ